MLRVDLERAVQLVHTQLNSGSKQADSHHVCDDRAADQSQYVRDDLHIV